MFKREFPSKYDDDDDNDGDKKQKYEANIGQMYGAIALTHYTSLKNLISILKEGKLKAGGISCSKMVKDCHDAIYFTVLFDFHLGSEHKPSQILLVFSSKLFEKVNSYFLNSGIKYGEKGDHSFNPIQFGEFRTNQIKQFDQTTMKSPFGQNEAVFLLDYIDLDRYLLEIRVVPFTKNSDRRYNFVIEELKKNKIPKKYIDRVVNVKDYIVKKPSFTEFPSQ